jgi:hypothetical protein
VRRLPADDGGTGSVQILDARHRRQWCHARSSRPAVGIAFA